MFTFINPKVEYPIHKLMGFDLRNTSLESISIPSVSSSLTFTCPFVKEGRAGLILTKEDTDVPNVNASEFLALQAKELELLLNKQQSPFEVCHALVYLLDGDLLNLVKKHSLSTLNNKYVFFKSPESAQPVGMNESIFELQVRNLSPVLVYPERMSYFNTKFERLSRLHNRGLAFQIDWLSLTGFYGSDAQKAALYLLESKFVEFIGFDKKNIPHILNGGGLRISKRIASLLDAQL